MDKEKDAIKSFLDDFGTEDQNQQSQFEEIPEDPFAHLKEDAEEPAPETEKPLPFNRDPKVQKYIEKEIQKAMEGFQKPQAKSSEETETKSNDEVSDTVSAFEAIIGNDTPEKVAALGKLKSTLSGFDQRAAASAIDAVNGIREREAKADAEAQRELADAFESIEESYGVDITSQKGAKLRTEFVTFVEKIAPKDASGEIRDYPDFSSAWETFAEMKRAQQQPSRAKELASRGVSRSSDANVSGPQKRITFDDAEAFIESLR